MDPAEEVNGPVVHEICIGECAPIYQPPRRLRVVRKIGHRA